MNDFVLFSVDYLRERAKTKPEGYLEDMLSNGVVENNMLKMKLENVYMLFEKYGGEAIRPKLKEATTKEALYNFVSAMQESAKTGFKRVSSEKHKERLDICSQCRFWKQTAYLGMGKCRKCGCSGLKLWLSTSRCPIQKWGPDTTENSLN